MDRFIGTIKDITLIGYDDLKSNMDRFIGKQRKQCC